RCTYTTCIASGHTAVCGTLIGNGCRQSLVRRSEIVVVIVMVVVVLTRRLETRLWFRGCNRGFLPDVLFFRLFGWSNLQRGTTNCREFILPGVLDSARRAGVWHRLFALGGGFYGFFGIDLERQALNRLQSNGDRFLPRLGTAHVLLQAGEEFI